MEKQYNILDSSDVVNVRTIANAYAKELGFDSLASAQVALGVSEIAENVLRYADRGMMKIKAKNNNRVLHIQITDSGAGFKDLTKAMKEGYSTSKNSLGLGLGIAKRAFDFFDVQTVPNKGNVFMMEKYLPLDNSYITYGVATMKDERYDHNGDIVYTKEYGGDKLLIAVIDGTGQGESALEMSNIVKEVIEENFLLPIGQIMINCDKALREDGEDSSAVITIARIIPNEIRYFGFGDTHSYLRKKAGTQNLKNQEGRLGAYQLPSLIVNTLSVASPYQLILCSDGIKTLQNDKFPDFDLSVQQTANFIFNNHHRLYGDASVLVLKVHRNEV